MFAMWEIAHEAEGKTPLVSMKMFKNRQFTSGASTMALLSLSQTGIIFVLPVFFQSVLGLDAFHTGIALIPISVGVLFAAPLAGNLSHRIAAKYIIQAGMILNFIALLVIRYTLKADLHITHLFPGLALFGLGMGAVMGPISNLTLSSVPVYQSGEASGVNNTMRQVGQSLGAAIIGAVLLTAITGNLQTGIRESSQIPEAAKAQILSVVSNPSTDIEFGGTDKVSAQLSPEIAAEISRVTKQATTDADKKALVFAALFSLMGFLASFALPNVRDLEKNEHTTAAAGH
jgi:MFS family permease